MTSLSDQQNTIDKLLSLGEVGYDKEWINYPTQGFKESDIGNLIKIATSEELHYSR